MSATRTSPSPPSLHDEKTACLVSQEPTEMNLLAQAKALDNLLLSKAASGKRCGQIEDFVYSIRDAVWNLGAEKAFHSAQQTLSADSFPALATRQGILWLLKKHCHEYKIIVDQFQEAYLVNLETMGRGVQALLSQRRGLPARSLRVLAYSRQESLNKLTPAYELEVGGPWVMALVLETEA